MNETYRYLVNRLRYEGRLTDHRAGELKANYILKRRFFGVCALLTFGTWLLLAAATPSWVWTMVETVILAILFMYLMHQTVLLEYKIRHVSERTGDYTDEFLDDFLKPSPDLHQIFRSWRLQGPIWVYDEQRLVELRQYARLLEEQEQ